MRVFLSLSNSEGPDKAVTGAHCMPGSPSHFSNMSHFLGNGKLPLLFNTLNSLTVPNEMYKDALLQSCIINVSMHSFIQNTCSDSLPWARTLIQALELAW